MTAPLTLRIAFLLTLPPLLWASNAVVGRALVGSVPPVTLNAARWLIALLLLLPLGWRALRDTRQIASRWRHFALLGLLGVGSYNALQYLALQTSTPLNVTLIASSAPVWMLLIGLLFYGERPGLRQIGSALLALAGALLVIARGSVDALLRVHLVPGDLLMLLAVMLWSGYSWMLARPPAHFRGAARPTWNWAEFLLVQVLFGAAWATLGAGVETSVSNARIAWTPLVIAAMLYVAVGPSLIAYRAWAVGIAAVGPTVAAFFGNLTPLFAAVLSAALLGEAPRWYHALAFALIAAGIVLSARSPRPG